MQLSPTLKILVVLPLLLASGACATTPAGSGPVTIRPGAPGEANQILSAEDLARIAHPEHTAADVEFMQGMLVHHAQALVMTAMVAERTANQDIRLLARRIELSQDDEMALMQRWLRERGEPEAPPADPHAAHGAHHGTDHVAMHGMLSEAQLAALAAAEGREFDRLFLQGMIQHHDGAVAMVADLFASPGAGQEEEIFQFASHVEADQNIEIRRMQGMLRAMR